MTASPGTVRVRAGYATIIGTTDGCTDRFRSVPYASALLSVADRLGPVTPVAGCSPPVVDATTHPPSPDRHSLSITTPAGASERGEQLPVVVFVHGGRFEEGDANEAWYRGDAFAASGCVFVSVNYRLGFDGFLPLEGEELPPDHDPAAEPEYFRGAEDVAEALRWVRANIAAFGGDPGAVTAVGQSAGGALLCWLLTIPRCAGLMDRCVVLSCGFPRVGWRARRWLAAWLLRGGLRGGRSAQKRLLDARRPRTPRAPLRLADAQQLSHDHLNRAYRLFSLAFKHDCAVGPRPFRPEAMAPVPMLGGSMRHEFANMPPAPAVDRLAQSRNPALSKAGWFVAAVVARWMGLRGVASDEREQPSNAARPLGRAIGDGAIRRWVARIARRQRGAGGPMWMYEFVGPARDRWLLAQHCGDLPLLFDALGVTPKRVHRFCGPDAQQRLSGLAKEFHQVVADFAKGVEPAWPQHTPESGWAAMRWDLGDGSGRVVRDPLGPVRAVDTRN